MYILLLISKPLDCNVILVIQAYCFTDKLIEIKRPGTGLPPNAKKFLLGKSAKRDIAYDEIIGFDDF